MADKSSGSSKATKASSKSTSGKSNAGKKTTTANKTTANKTTTSRKKPTSSASRSTSSKTTSQKKPTSQAQKPTAAQSAAYDIPVLRRLVKWLTLNRFLDISGILFVFIGLILLLSLLSTNNSEVTGTSISFMRRVFGYGVYVFPVLLIFSGLWLILRNFDRIPELTLPRGVGFILLYLNFLAILHFVAVIGADPDADPRELAMAGLGGGYIGAGFYWLLSSIFGISGMAISLIAWLLISLVLAFDVGVVELASWVGDRYQALSKSIKNKLPGQHISGSQYKMEPGQQELVYGEPAAPRDMLPASSPQYFYPTGYQPARDGHVQEQYAWKLPQLEQILEMGVEVQHDDAVEMQRARLIEETLASFGAPVRVVETNRGPTITQFGIEPDFVETRSGRTRVRVSKITALANDLALALSARSIRIEAPVPGKGYIGIEVPNDEISLVTLRDVVESEAFKRMKSPLRFALGENVSGQAVAADLAAMPHLLIAGQTGSGKSVCVNSLICCLLLNNTPDDLRLIMVDPKRVELTGYNGIPHLLAPVIVELERVVSALQWVAREMDMRYRKLADVGSRNIQDYNARMEASGQKKLPYLVVVIDELADLMMLAPDDTERTLTRLAQLSRATGIHLVIATQRPSVDVVTGLIKANFPARIAFAVASNVDSRVILDQPGAETLLGRGDMLFQAPDAPATVRLQGVYLSDMEILHLVSYWQQYTGLITPAPTAIEAAIETLPGGIPLKQMTFWKNGAAEEEDPMFIEAVDLARRQGRASVSMLQRRLRIGYTRAARIIEAMEEKGIVGPPEPGSGVREILDYGQAAPPVDDV